MNGERYMITGESSGDATGFKWVTNQWTSYPAIVTGLEIAADGAYTHFSTFIENSDTFLVLNGVPNKAYLGFKYLA
jgi:phage-related protein